MTGEDKQIIIKELESMREKIDFYSIMLADMNKRMEMIISGLKRDASFKNMPDHLDSPGPEGITAPPGLQLLIEREEGNFFDKKDISIEYHK